MTNQIFTAEEHLQLANNGTLRELMRQQDEFHARTGEQFGAMWITSEKFALLPQMIRVGSGTLKVNGVPIRVVEVLKPDGVKADHTTAGWKYTYHERGKR